MSYLRNVNRRAHRNSSTESRDVKHVPKDVLAVKDLMRVNVHTALLTATYSMEIALRIVMKGISIS